jgi:hypothetical protein
MKQTNLLSLVQAYKNLPESTFEKFLIYHEIKVKREELEDISVLVKTINTINKGVDIFDNFTIGFSIPQIGKEFDLLRFSKKKVINLEIKLESTPEKIKKQLIRNRYYLGFLGLKIVQATFISSEEKFYQLNDDDELVSINIEEISDKLENQNSINQENVSSLFDPSNYLVSPFNSTDKFVNNEYFLTLQQELIKKNVETKFTDPKISFASVTGEAGTGKTLLTYDIAKQYMLSGKKVLIIHCAKLNAGQNRLCDDFGWEIIPAKLSTKIALEDYDLIVLDEVQRMYPMQLKIVISAVREHSKKCIFSYDQEQCLSNWEINNKNHASISKLAQPVAHKLTKSIRTNKEIAIFIKALMNKNVEVSKIQSGNVEFMYFNKYVHARLHIQRMKELGWEMINFTPDRRLTYNYEKFSESSSDNAHGIIGQEFEKVVAVIDFHFQYVNGKMDLRGYQSAPYYNPLKMLSQIMTRTRGKLYLIVINNDEVAERALNLLSGTVTQRTS